MTHLSLFSGIGGIDLAAEWAGFQTIGLVERDAYCQKVLAKNFPGVPIYDDITTFNGFQFRGRTAVVSAGFPCQPHSLAGKRLASGDERDLWGVVVRVLGEVQPRWFVGENVPGLFSSERGAFFGRILNDLAELGYRIGWCCYGASDVGAVHRRKRVFIVAYGEGVARNGGPAINRTRRGARDVGASDREGEVTNPQDLLGNGGGTQSEPEPFPELGDRDCTGDASDSKRGGRGRTPEGNAPEQGRDESEDGLLVRDDATDSSREPSAQASQTTCPERGGRDARHDAGGRIYRPIAGGDWRTWTPQPVICKLDDEFSCRLVRHRVTEPAEYTGVHADAEKGRRSQVLPTVRDTTSEDSVPQLSRGRDPLCEEEILQQAMLRVASYESDCAERGVPSESKEVQEGKLRSLRDAIKTSCSSPQWRPITEHPRELSDAVRLLSSEMALAEWEEAGESLCTLQGLFDAFAEMGVLPEAWATLQEVWRSISDEDKTWAVIRACTGNPWVAPRPSSERPVIQLSDVRLPRWVVRDRVKALKALGNAVVPQQIYPVFQAIAEVERATD